MAGWGSGMGWVLRLVETGVEGSSRSVDVMAIDSPSDLSNIADLGLTLVQGKRLVALVQQEIVTAQSRDHAVRRPDCRTCTIPCHVKDYRPHRIATLFGQVMLRLPRFHCAGCGGVEAGHGWPAHCRSTPEFDQVRAQFSACMPYRVAAGVSVLHGCGECSRERSLSILRISPPCRTKPTLVAATTFRGRSGA